MKVVATLVTLSFLSSNLSGANGQEPRFWPEYGTLASHNEWAIKAIGGDIAHQLGASGAGVKVAVLDSGIATNIPGLSEKVIAYKDFLPSQPQLPEHGTMTASTVAADYDPNTGAGGIAPGASLIIGRVCYLMWCDSEKAKRAVEWAIEEGAQVISMSFGGYFHPEFIAILELATRKGVVVVSALGNSGCSTYENWGMNPYCTQGKTNENSNASYPIAGLIGAGASNQYGARASFSSWGPNLDLIAPGVENISYDPNGATNGFGGTSAATPLIAGSAALVLEANPNLRPDQVQAILQATARTALEKKAKVWDSCTRSTETNKWTCNQEVDSIHPQHYFTGAGIVAADRAVLLARRIADDNTLDAPIVTSTGTDVVVSWAGPAADVYLNSKLLAKAVESPFSFTGVMNQSLAIQLVRDWAISTPTLRMVKTGNVPRAPLFTSHSFGSDQINLYLGDITNLDPNIAWIPFKWYSSIGGIFQTDDGRELPCSGQGSTYPDPDSLSFTLTCKSKAGPISGRLRLISPDGTLGEPSETISGTVYKGLDVIDVRTTHLSTDSLKFDWDPVPGAVAYEYRYLPEYTFSCTTGTTVTINSPMSQPSSFTVIAKSNEDCSGNALAISEGNGFRLLNPPPPKPTNVTVDQITPTFIRFDAPQTDPSYSWRLYRSDGLFLRFDGQGSKLMVGIQPNEDVNRRSFTYRFMEVRPGMWGETWSPLSDPITVSFANLPAPAGVCYENASRYGFGCDIAPNQFSDGTLIEFLDSDGQVIASRDTKRWTGQRFNFSRVRGAYSVRLTSTMGDIPNWYRRGDSVTIPISKRFGYHRNGTVYAQ